MLSFLSRLVALFLWFSSLALATVNVNTASATELETLPGIGPAKAAAIIDYRTEHGDFSTVEELDDVPGIGPATLANIRPHVIVEAGDEPATDAGEPEPGHPSCGTGDLQSCPGININTATAEELDELPGIGPAKAATIVEDREANGPFTSCEDLTRVPGIGRTTVSNLIDQCAVDDSGCGVGL